MASLLPSPPQVTLFLGKLNAIAPFVTMFFLVSYMVVNLACFALKVAAAPNFRPTFQIYARYTCKYKHTVNHLVDWLVYAGSLYLMTENDEVSLLRGFPYKGSRVS